METDGRARLFTIRATDRGNTSAVLVGVVFAVLLVLIPALSAQAYAAPAPSAATQRFYVVGAPVDGQREFLFAIAAQCLGDGKRYREIFDLNRGRPQPDGRVMNDPTVVEPGWILLLPDDARGPGVRAGPLPSVPPPSDLPSAGTPAAPAEAEPEADEGGVSPSLLATVAGLLLAALAVPLLLRRSRRVPASAGPSPGNAGTSRPHETRADTTATIAPPTAAGIVKLPLVRGLPRPEPAPEPSVTTRPSAAPVASTPPALAGPATPPSSAARLTSAGPSDPPPVHPRSPAAPPPVGTASPDARPDGSSGTPWAPTANPAATPGATGTAGEPERAASAPAAPPPVERPPAVSLPPERRTTVSPPVAPQPAQPRTEEPQPPAPQAAEPQPPAPQAAEPQPPTPQAAEPQPPAPRPGMRPQPVAPQSGVPPRPAPTRPAPPPALATPLASPRPVSPPPAATPRPVTPLTPTTAPNLVSAPLASARPTPVPAPRPAADDLPPSTARLIPVESPEPPAEPAPGGDRDAADPSAATPAPVVTGLRRAIALPTGDLQRVAGIGSLAATAPGWFPPLVTELDADGTPTTVRLVGARPARWGSAYGWLEESWRPPPSSIPVVLGEHDGRRLWVDLAAVPDVLTLGGDEDACRRLGVRLLDQLGPTVDVVVVADALGAGLLPQRCRRLGSVEELAGLEPAALRVVFCPGAAAGVLWRERRSLAGSGQRTVPVVVGEAPPARWSVRAMAEGPAI
ncbi:hypothetical protein [Micromonospora sp. 067-2]|uniref:hypothetical protein n=1 Tax=Micromonospora sp. 067-2 TaxID=2789270 RepID=UPI00397CAC21